MGSRSRSTNQSSTQTSASQTTLGENSRYIGAGGSFSEDNSIVNQIDNSVKDQSVTNVTDSRQDNRVFTSSESNDNSIHDNRSFTDASSTVTNIYDTSDDVAIAALNSNNMALESLINHNAYVGNQADKNLQYLAGLTSEAVSFFGDQRKAQSETNANIIEQITNANAEAIKEVGAQSKMALFQATTKTPDDDPDKMNVKPAAVAIGFGALLLALAA